MASIQSTVADLTPAESDDEVRYSRALAQAIAETNQVFDSSTDPATVQLWLRQDEAERDAVEEAIRHSLVENRADNQRVPVQHEEE